MILHYIALKFVNLCSLHLNINEFTQVSNNLSMDMNRGFSGVHTLHETFIDDSKWYYLSSCVFPIYCGESGLLKDSLYASVTGYYIQ